MKTILAIIIFFGTYNLCYSQDENNRSVFSMKKENAVIINRDTLKQFDNNTDRVKVSAYKNVTIVNDSLGLLDNIELKKDDCIQDSSKTLYKNNRSILKNGQENTNPVLEKENNRNK